MTYDVRSGAKNSSRTILTGILCNFVLSFARGNSRSFRSSGREYRGLDYWFKNYYKTLPTVILRSRIEETGI